MAERSPISPEMNPTPEAQDKRSGSRIKAGIEVYFSAAREEGRAVLSDVSSVGVLLAETPSRPAVGARVRLTVHLPNRGRRLQVVGYVDRHTQDGFAIEYERPNPYLCASVVEEADPITPDRGDAATLKETAGTDVEDAAPEAGEGASSLRETLGFILEAALDGRHGGVEPEEALDIIIDRTRDALEGQWDR